MTAEKTIYIFLAHYTEAFFELDIDLNFSIFASQRTTQKEFVLVFVFDGINKKKVC